MSQFQKDPEEVSAGTDKKKYEVLIKFSCNLRSKSARSTLTSPGSIRVKKILIKSALTLLSTKRLRITEDEDPNKFFKNSKKNKYFAPGEARTHGLQIMRLTRCLLRYGSCGTEMLSSFFSLSYQPTRFFSLSFLLLALCSPNCQSFSSLCLSPSTSPFSSLFYVILQSSVLSPYSLPSCNT